MFGLGMGELLIVLLILLLVFGASRVSSLGDALGRGVRNFRKAIKGDDRDAGNNPQGTQGKNDNNN